VRIAEIVEFLGGLLLVLAVGFDVFQTVVLPRPTPVTFRPSGRLVGVLYRLVRRASLRIPSQRERLLGVFGPAAVVFLLVFWAAGLVAGFGLLFHAVAEQFTPSLSWGTTWYFSATSLTTLGFGDLVPVGGLARALTVLEAASGLGLVALMITFLFSLFGEFQRRELLVITLSTRAGAPPSGPALLETYAGDEMLERLPRLFEDWETWAAQVLDSHLSYPLLVFFRSTHDNQSWVSALGAVLDAATLVLTTIEGVPRGPARAMQRGGVHLVEDLAQYFHFDTRRDPYVERAEFDEAFDQLCAAGLRLAERETAWLAFSNSRAAYATALNAMARQWVTPPARWIGDRSLVPLHQSGAVWR
jgi:hypothetical protein